MKSLKSNIPARKTKPNEDYIEIINKGYEINITTTNGGNAWLYILDNGTRIPNIKISFKSNNQAGYKLIIKSVNARRHTHLGNALAEANSMLTEKAN